jgi:hypothetical protein
MTKRGVGLTLKADALTGAPRPQESYSCWRCGCMIPGNVVHPAYVCEPCLDVLDDEDLAWVGNPANQPGYYTWEMVPLGRACGGE